MSHHLGRSSEAFPAFDIDDDLLPPALREIIHALPAALTIQNSAGNYLFVSAAASELFDLSDMQVATGVVSEREKRRRAAAGLIADGRSVLEEQIFVCGPIQKTYCTKHQPVEYDGQTYLLSLSHDVTDERAYQDRLLQRALYDELTGLPMRKATEQHIEVLIESQPEMFALAFLDIDDFKQINDLYGHAVGDRILIEFSRRVEQGLRDSDVFCRISGDEFLLLINPVISQTDLSDFILRLSGRLKEPYFIEGSELFASASIGVSLYPDHATNLHNLCRNADTAMYHAKNGQKGTAVFFDPKMETEAVNRLAVERVLRLAILDDKLCCAFQPKVDIRSNKIVGVEALVRLRDEHGRIQAPGTFIGLATELGLINEITLLVFRRIFETIDLINTEFGTDTTISMNVAAQQACDISFMRSFCEAIEASGLGHRLIIEVTEDAFVAAGSFQKDVLPMLHAIGARVSIDDFGTGYSSLSALANITADELKIDRSFITDIHKRPRSQGVLRAIESLGSALNMVVIAEGIETYEELLYLQAATNIKYAQGFYFSKPVHLEPQLERTLKPISDDRHYEDSRLQAYATRFRSLRS